SPPRPTCRRSCLRSSRSSHTSWSRTSRFVPSTRFAGFVRPLDRSPRSTCRWMSPHFRWPKPRSPPLRRPAPRGLRLPRRRKDEPMNAFLMRSRDLAWWLAPLVALLALAASMMDMAHGADAPAAQAAVAKPVVPELLPEYNIGGGPESRSETVNRTLFNPTRRPAPTPVQEAPKAQMQRGQFVLTGTTVVDGKATAFLREVKTGKSRRVTQGESLNGMSVTEVKPDRVKLTMGDESEEVTLKVIANPRSTPGAPPPPMVAGGAPAGSPGAPGVPQSGVIVDGPGVGQTPEQMAQ